ncbi:hypothetical protein JHK85_001593 [Glycine max]|nr:hypothetical protein JHK85_001593 [Glycine max]
MTRDSCFSGYGLTRTRSSSCKGSNTLPQLPLDDDKINAYRSPNPNLNFSPVILKNETIFRNSTEKKTPKRSRTEVELLGEIINIVNLVLTSLDKFDPESSRLIGIDKQIQHLESLLHQESKYVRVIGIWGMGGIGKTTIAEEIFSKLRSEYDGYYFLANVKEESSRQGTIYLKRKLFSAILGEDVEMDHVPRLSNYIKRKIGRMKVLIVLDDVNDSNLPEKLFENHDWFGRGSKIIITTRDKQVLIANKVDDIYQVGALNNSEALELFSLYAFNQNHFDMEYYKLSEMVVNYAKGIPLVLKVLGRLLCGKDKEVWESQLHKLENMPNTDIYHAMRLSFDDLDRKEQKILLDLACFFIGLNLKLDSIKVLLKDNERDDSVVAGLERLKDKALVTISEDNVISMHDIIQEMAWEIVRQESIEDPGNRSRLIDPNDVYEVLKYNKGTEAIRSIRANLPAIQNLQLSPHVFNKMSKLQFVYFRKKFDVFPLLPRGLQSFPAELRYLSWSHYPLISLPENFSAENLVIFDLSGSLVLKLWDGVQNLMNLKVLTVAGCLNLKELPDLSKATNLEFLEISSCSQLLSMNPSILSLKKLERLSSHHCSLNTLISDNHLTSLKYLNLRGCKALSQFSVTSENMIELDLSFTSVSAFPSTFGRQSNLKILSLVFTNIESLPSSFRNLTRLRYLSVESSRKLHTLSLTELPASLEVLDATDCKSLKTVYFPSIAEQFKENRREILFWNCLELDEHSLKAIGFNARINVMKSAYHNLSATGEKNVDFYLRYSRSYQVKYVYPGSSIPEWLEYKTTKDYLIIDLSSTPHSTLLGFVFSFVIAESKDHNRAVFLDYPFYITVSEGEGESEKGGIDIFVSHTVRVESGVCVMYDQECSHYLHSRAKNQTRLKIKVTTKEVAPSDSKRGLELKGFGVTPITSSVYQNFIQEINSSADHSFNQQVNTSADHSFIQQTNSPANHSFIQQTNSSANHSFIQQINTSADHSFIQQVNFSADHIFIQQMEVPSSMLFTQILAIIIILLIPFWFLVVKRRRL